MVLPWLKKWTGVGAAIVVSRNPMPGLLQHTHICCCPKPISDGESWILSLGYNGLGAFDNEHNNVRKVVSR